MLAEPGCRRSTAVVQRFCKPKVGSSILSAGTITISDLSSLEPDRPTPYRLAGAPLTEKNSVAPSGVTRTADSVPVW